MTRPGSGAGPDDGRLMPPPSGWRADAGQPAAEPVRRVNGRSRHAADEEWVSEGYPALPVRSVNGHPRRTAGFGPPPVNGHDPRRDGPTPPPLGTGRPEQQPRHAIRPPFEPDVRWAERWHTPFDGSGAEPEYLSDRRSLWPTNGQVDNPTAAWGAQVPHPWTANGQAHEPRAPGSGDGAPGQRRDQHAAGLWTVNGQPPDHPRHAQAPGPPGQRRDQHAAGLWTVNGQPPDHPWRGQAPGTAPLPGEQPGRRPAAANSPPPGHAWTVGRLAEPGPRSRKYPSAPWPADLAQPSLLDEDATQLLHRYVPAREVLDREERDTPTRGPQARPSHPPRAVVRRRRARRRLLEWPLLVVVALLSAYLIRAYAVQTFYIPSGSMHETLLEGDRVLVNKVGYHLHAVNRGDVVVFRRPPDFPVEDQDLIKRVIGLPGETVEARDRKLYVDGRPLSEPYVERRCAGTEDFPPVTVPPHTLWVMGDNRCNSSDSRVFGPIGENLVVGRAFVLAWPFTRLSWL
ncbi:MAG TPA: signal peptidase I [Mycobacteriales bacterium]|nr:signal peptidase I [Mycobacteriales bacterium]